MELHLTWSYAARASLCGCCGSSTGSPYRDGFGYSRFYELHRPWAKRLNPPVSLTHKAGEKMFVDYPGQTVPVVDLAMGELPKFCIRP